MNRKYEMNVKTCLQIMLLYFATLPSINSELEDLIKSVYLRSNELEKIIKGQEDVIANQSKVIEQQKELISSMQGKYKDVYL